MKEVIRVDQYLYTVGDLFRVAAFFPLFLLTCYVAGEIIARATALHRRHHTGVLAATTRACAQVLIGSPLRLILGAAATPGDPRH